MQFLIISAGKPSLSYAKEGVDLYLSRLKPLGNVQLQFVKDGNSADVSERLLTASQGCLRIAMDERGKLHTTEEITGMVNHWRMTAVKKVAFLIGASDGHTEALRQKCDSLMALSKFTLQHELALVVLLEQIYRIHTIIAGTPYHR